MNAVIYDHSSFPGAGPPSKLFLGSCGGGKNLFLNLLGFDGFLTPSKLLARVAHLGTTCSWPLHRKPGKGSMCVGSERNCRTKDNFKIF